MRVRPAVAITTFVAIATMVAASATAAPAPTAVQPGSPKIAETAGSQFPAKAYVLSLPKSTKVPTGQVTVLENGQPVNDLQIDLPGNTGSASFGVVLLIDASNSMIGDPIVQAMAAARTFAAHRAPREQLAVVLFNSTTKVLLPLTSDGTKIGKALAKKPRLAYGTHIYDAVAAAEDLLKTANVSVGSIVLLSDGKDVGSTIDQATTLQNVEAARSRIFSVGLQSRQFDATTLDRLATATGGSFSVASNAASLEQIYKTLGTQISSEYLIRYRSFAGPAQRVYLAVKVAGFSGVAVASYVTPGLPAGVTIHRSLWDRIIASPITAIVVALLVAALIGLAVSLLVRRRDRRFEQRLAQFVSFAEAAARTRRANVAAELEDKEAPRSLTDFGWYKRFLDDAEVGRIEMSPARMVSLTVLASLALGGIVWALTSSPLGLLAGLAGPFIARWAVGFRASRVRAAFAEQLPDNLDVVSAALRAGHSLVGGLSVTVDAAGEPSRRELGRALADEQLGVALDEALRLVAKRMANRDLIQVSIVARLQREAGTNAAEVLEQVAVNVRHQMELRRLVKTLTAQGRMARWIVSALPLFLFGALYTLNKAYLKPLWSTNIGIVAICGAAVMVFAGSFIIKKIVEIEV